MSLVSSYDEAADYLRSFGEEVGTSRRYKPKGKHKAYAPGVLTLEIGGKVYDRKELKTIGHTTVRPGGVRYDRISSTVRAAARGMRQKHERNQDYTVFLTIRSKASDYEG